MRYTCLCLLTLVCTASEAQRFGVQIQPEARLREQLDQDQEIGQIRIARQFGSGYLPLMVMRQFALIEKHASAAGLGNIQVRWTLYPSGQAMNEALRLGFLDFASGGVVPLLKSWDRTRESRNVRGIAALASMPLYLNTRRIKVRSLRDFTDQDRIALPAVQTSIQAVILQMAAAQAFGPGGYTRLDKLTVSMPHPQARDALLAGKSGITGHLTSPPFQYEELQDRHVHRVLNSYDVLGGSATFTTLWTTSQFRELNPRTFRAVYDALREAVDILNRNKREAAKIFIQQANSPRSVEFVEKIIAHPEIQYTIAPENVLKYARFMFGMGTIKRAPASWKDVFFPEVYADARD
ncbi:MAG: ABC transporter substrate-binding protein [Acidiferrobacterales bacterium]